MPKVVDAVEQRREIRRAARGVFARHGVTGTGLARVADAAGMGRSSLYHYYGDKAALVRDLVRDLLAEELALFESALEREAPALERIEALAAAMPDLFDQWALLGRLILELRSRDSRLFRPYFRRLRETLARVIAEGQEQGEISPAVDPEIAASVWIGAIDGLLLQYLVDPAAFDDPDTLRRQLVVLLRRMLAP